MSAQREAIIGRLRKVLALVKHGVGGEKDNAERQLEAMLKKHGLTMADVDDVSEERVKLEVTYKDEYEKMLVRQIIGFVINDTKPKMMRYQGARSKMHIRVTRSQKIECELYIEALKPVLADYLEMATVAFINKQHLFPDASSDAERPPLTPEERERLMRISMMAESMDKHDVILQIGVVK